MSKPLSILFGLIALIVVIFFIYSNTKLFANKNENKQINLNQKMENNNPDPTQKPDTATSSAIPKSTSQINGQIKMLKDVGEAYMHHFGLTEEDFAQFKKLKVNLIQGNFDICANDKDIKYLLDNSQKYNIKVIMPAGSGEAEWSYECDKEPYPKDQKPKWNREGVMKFVNKWKNHPAIYAWDTSNEAGSVLPNANQDTYSNMLTLAQIQTAYRDVKAADPNHPIMNRHNGWFYYDFDSNFFRMGNPFTSEVADIIMINAYSNVEEYFPDFVTTVVNRAQKAILEVDPNVTFIVSLGVWNEPPLWKKPSTKQLQNDLDQYKKLNNVIGIAYFKYGAKNSEWYLPKDSPDLLPQITNN